jgi:hypothetical protein
MVSPRSRTGLAGALLVLLATAGVLAVEPLVLGGFSPSADPAGPPLGWEALTFAKVPHHSRYTLVRDGAG